MKFYNLILSFLFIDFQRISLHKMKTMLLGAVFFALTFICTSAAPSNSDGKRVVCYFGSWAVYRYGAAKITEDDIEPGICDYFIYTFVGLDESTNKVRLLDAWNDVGDDWHRGLMPLIRDKARAQGTKFMVALGGWNEGSESYSKVVGNPARRAILVADIVNFVETYQLDGFDLDWEYPGQRGGGPNDKAAFSALVSELQAQFEPRGWTLSAAVGANALTLDISYDIPLISSKLSFINVMTYDLHGSWDPVTGHNAPLVARSTDAPENAHLNVESALQAWIDRGASPQKINIGIATYGRSFTLTNPNQHGFNAPTQGIPPAGWTNEAGFFGYDEICSKNGTTFTTAWDEEQQVPYAYGGSSWIGFDDAESVRRKICLANRLNLGGALVWTIDSDDFHGNCGKGKFPLIKTISSAFADPSCGGSNSQPPVITPPVVTDAPATEAPGTDAPAPEVPAPDVPTPEVPAPEVPAPDVPAPEAPETEVPPTEVPAPNPPVTGAPPTTVPTPTQPSTPNNGQSSINCSFIGERIRDPQDCSIFWYCGPGPLGSIVPNKFNCGQGLSYDSTISSCNFRTLVRC